MNEMNLRTVDLNLLTVFSAIYDHGRLTRAAEVLGMTQPAVSHALRRLRILFDDPLFERAKTRMEPTARAHAIAGPVSEILGGVREILDTGTPFDPAAAKREVRIGMLDYGLTLFAPQIAAFVTAAAPAVQIDFRHAEAGNAIRMIDDGDLDLYIGPFAAPPAGYRYNPMISSDAVVVARKGHPSMPDKLSVSAYCALDHVRFSNLTGIDREIDTILRERNLSRRTVMTVPHYSSALFAVARSDLVATITRGPALLYRDFLGLRLYDTPFRLAASEIALLRHPRTDTDALIVWMWDRIRALDPSLPNAA